MLHKCSDDSSSNFMCEHEGICTYSSSTSSYTCACQPQWAGIDCSGMRCTEPDIVCYNQVDYDSDICTPKGCDCLNDGYGADCRGVRCGLEPGRCYHGAVCIDSFNSTCSACPSGTTGHDCSMSTKKKNNKTKFFFELICSFFLLVSCPGVPSGYCFHGGVCVNGTSCLCGFRSDWSGVDCSESLMRFFKITNVLLFFSSF